MLTKGKINTQISSVNGMDETYSLLYLHSIEWYFATWSDMFQC